LLRLAGKVQQRDRHRKEPAKVGCRCRRQRRSGGTGPGSSGGGPGRPGHGRRGGDATRR
jgi:hypothetical protein